MVMATGAIAEQTVEEKVDSLFIIAASLDIKFRDLVEPARDSIAAMGTAAVPKLIDMLGTPHGRERAALEVIFKKIGEQAVPQLNEALLTTDSLRLSRVAKALSFNPDTSSVTNLLKVVDNDYYSARYQAVMTLGKIGDARAIPAVRVAMSDTIELVRTVAAVSAGRLGDESLFPDLIAAFDDPYYGVRMSAQEALKTAACSIKVEFITSVVEEVSTNAQKHLMVIIAEDSCQYEMDAVISFFHTPDPVLMSHALKAAYRLDPDYVTGFLSSPPEDMDSFILNQTIEDILRHHEAETPAEP
jgi:hypothetical protein